MHIVCVFSLLVSCCDFRCQYWCSALRKMTYCTYCVLYVKKDAKFWSVTDVCVKVKVKVGFLYSAAYAMTGPARFTISEVLVDWQEPMVLQHKLRPSNCTR